MSAGTVGFGATGTKRRREEESKTERRKRKPIFVIK